MRLIIHNVPEWHERIHFSRGLVHHSKEPGSGDSFYPGAFVPKVSGTWNKWPLEACKDEFHTLKITSLEPSSEEGEQSILWLGLAPFNPSGALPEKVLKELKDSGLLAYGRKLSHTRLMRNFPYGHTTSNNPAATPPGSKKRIRRIGMHRDEGPNSHVPPLGRIVMNCNTNGSSRYFFFAPENTHLSYFGKGGARCSGTVQADAMEALFADIMIVRIELNPFEAWAAIPSFIHDGFTLSANDNLTLDIFLDKFC